MRDTWLRWSGLVGMVTLPLVVLMAFLGADKPTKDKRYFTEYDNVFVVNLFDRTPIGMDEYDSSRVVRFDALDLDYNGTVYIQTYSDSGAPFIIAVWEITTTYDPTEANIKWLPVDTLARGATTSDSTTMKTAGYLVAGSNTGPGLVDTLHISGTRLFRGVAGRIRCLQDSGYSDAEISAQAVFIKK